MKQIIIKQLHLTNFKGVSDLTVDFNDTITTISGRNGLGKTTIFDAFTWLLFGKDSKERKAFDLKTYDTNGKTIPRIPHEVSGVLDVDGEEITLCRKFNEKWTKKRGTSEEVFTGNEEERLYNDVPMSLKDWNEKINGICPEQVFKFITNPLYFTAQKTDVQRTMLLRMAGDVSDEAIAAENVDFKELLGQLTGKTMDEYKREIGAKKKRIKAELDAIPERIDERKRDMPDAEDWDALTKQLADKQAEVDAIDEQLNDAAAKASAANEERMAVTRELNDVKLKIQQRAFAVKEQVTEDYRKQLSGQNKLVNDVRDKQLTLGRIVSNIDSKNKELAECSAKRERMIAEWKEINGRSIVFDENDFVCPTCHRRFEIDEIESKQAEMTENFNAQKAADLADNNKRGKANSEWMSALKASIDNDKQELDKVDADIKALKGKPLYGKTLAEPDATPTIEADAEYNALQTRATELAKALEAEKPVTDNSELIDKKNALANDIDDIKTRLGKREYIDKNNKRIAELEKEHKRNAEELAQLERIEFTMMQFAKARIAAVEDKINGMFQIVKFKMFDTQINGGEVETCEATIDGVPFNMLNNAARYIAGLDIINAICKYEGISAPVVIDNAEAINNLPHVDSQMIALYVSDDDKLVIA